MSPANTLSFVIFSSLLFLLALPLLRVASRRVGGVAWLGLPLLLLVFAGAWLGLRVGDSEISSADQFDATVGSGKPVVLEIYSNY